MSDAATLQAYREKVMALRVLQAEFARCGASGAPRGVGALQPTGLPRGTNDPQAAALQLADGLEAIIARHRRELDALWPQVLAVTSAIDDARMYRTIHAYYVLGQSLDEIARQMFVSYRTVSRWKKSFMDSLAG